MSLQNDANLASLINANCMPTTIRYLLSDKLSHTLLLDMSSFKSVRFD